MREWNDTVGYKVKCTDQDYCKRNAITQVEEKMYVCVCVSVRETVVATKCLNQFKLHLAHAFFGAKSRSILLKGKIALPISKWY